MAPVDTLAVASLNDKLDKLLVKAPTAGFVETAADCHDTVTVGLAEPDFHILAVKEIVNPVTGAPELFCSSQVDCAFDADPEPKKERLLFAYQPPVVPVVCAVPLQVFPVVAVRVQFAGEFPVVTAVPDAGEVKDENASTTGVVLLITACPCPGIGSDKITARTADIRAILMRNLCNI